MKKLTFSLYKTLYIIFTFLMFSSTVFGLEFHPGYDRANPPPSGYWYSNVAGGYNPWTDDIQKPLMTFSAENEGLDLAAGPVEFRKIKFEEAGWDMSYYNRPTGALPIDKASFVDLGTLNGELTGTNWVHGNGYTYPTDTWVLQFTDEGSFNGWYVPELDLHEYRGIAIEVSNLGDTYIFIDSNMNKWLGKGHHAVIGLEPGETDILYHPFRRNETEVNKFSPGATDYFEHVHHLCGYPGGQLFESVFSDIYGAEGPWTIHAKVPPGVKKGNVKWTVNRMWAGGRYHVPTTAEREAAGHNEADYNDTLWTDQYGQWKYDDWVGKLWNDQDAIDQYSKLTTYMTDNPGPSQWNQWGGWESGPQLEATGWFRVEKFNNKWWFVDPEGKLFLSQGSLHMSANTPGPAAIAGYDDSTFPDEIYFPRLRSMGINTAGGNSSWKWHTGKLPYTYQIKTGLAPIDENDILDKGGEEGFKQWIESFLASAQGYANDPYCIGFIVDNELAISGGETLSKFDVERIYFAAIRRALNKMSQSAGRPPMIMIDPASNGGKWMANYCDVLSMHRMDGYAPGYNKLGALGKWGIDKPGGQFTFTMGNLDVGVAHYGLTMFLNQRNRAQGMTKYMRQAYAHRDNIATHIYSYGKWKKRPLAEFRMIQNITDTTDYFLADYLREVGDDMYPLHLGMNPNTQLPSAFDYTYVTDSATQIDIRLYGVDLEDMKTGDILSYTVVTAPMYGSLSQLSGTLDGVDFPTYTPDPNHSGITDTFTFTVTDSLGNVSAPATASVTVKGLVAHWPMDDAFGTVVTDVSGNSHHGTFSGGTPVWREEGPVSGSGALAFSNSYATHEEFDEVNGGYVTVVDEGAVVDLAEPVKLKDDWTVSLWVLRRDSGIKSTLLSGDNGVAIELEQENDSTKVGISNGNLKWTFAYTAPINVWTQLSLVKKDDIVMLYANGKAILPTDPDGGLDIHNGTLRTDLELSITRIGSTLDATVDDIRLYNYALTEQEATNFYTSQSYIDYHGTVFEENEENDGGVDTVLTMTLVNGGSFAADVVSQVSVSNYPASLQPVFTRVSDTEITLAFTGNANANSDSDDMHSLTVDFTDDAFVLKSAAQITNSYRDDLMIDFQNNAKIVVGSSVFYENANVGSISNSIQFNLDGERFTAEVASSILVDNLPEGLTALFIRDSDTQVTMKLLGHATAHENADSIDDLMVTFDDTAFVSGNAGNVSNSTVNGIRVYFASLDVHYEAESAEYGVVNVVDFEGASGGTYLDMYSAPGEFGWIKWEVEVPWDCEADFTLSYALGKDWTNNHINVNGEVVSSWFTMLKTHGSNWTTFRPYGPVRINLKQGKNTIMFRSNKAHVDSMELTLFPPVETAPCSLGKYAAQGTNECTLDGIKDLSSIDMIQDVACPEGSRILQGTNVCSLSGVKDALTEPYIITEKCPQGVVQGTQCIL